VSWPVAAHADYAGGPWSNFVNNGITYTHAPAINTSAGFATATTFVAPVYVCVTAGSLAAQGRVIQQYGQSAAVLVSESVTKYSTWTICPGSGSYMSAQASYAGTGDFYSYGRSYVYNTAIGGYNYYMTIPGYVQHAW